MQNNTTPPSQNFTQTWQYKTENILKIIFIITSFIYLPLTYFKIIQISIGILTCIFGIIRQLGPISLTKEYLAKLIARDFTTTMLYLITLFSISKANFAFMLPVNVFFSIGASEFVKRTNISFLKHEKILKVADSIVKVKGEFKRGRVYIELFLFFYSLCMIMKIGFFFPLFLFNYLRLKSQTNAIAYQTFFRFKSDIDGILSYNKIPNLVSVILKKFNGLFFKFVANIA